ncbi:hypothetical protein [Actinomadura sp. NEAU-AAG7]|uniref:hypothetical protein n=1 Tax=Actinomadura sp. NEAU-AAG7 TaxID=2839640 RepID=UPI001BE4BD66|nr:hypothetical protein [Actinomadura sp. NEAU-AAG7]MBT2208257.1 hypothetical protein [Actinomadura sp. NEAU-AAG7]
MRWRRRRRARRKVDTGAEHPPERHAVGRAEFDAQFDAQFPAEYRAALTRP